jgi:hypothetical protein
VSVTDHVPLKRGKFNLSHDIPNPALVGEQSNSWQEKQVIYLLVFIELETAQIENFVAWKCIL